MWELWGPLCAALVTGYLLGSIPFGLILTKLAGLGDIRAVGSGNIGATNVLRTGNKLLAVFTLLLDGGKGAAAVLIFSAWTGPEGALLAGRELAAFAAASSLLGHLFPVWLKFRGGKGVATSLGVLLAMEWPVGILACLTWLVVGFLFRYSSLAALAALTAAPFYAWSFYLSGAADLQVMALAIFIAALTWARHHANIRRLLDGTETKIGAKAAAPPALDAE